MSDQFVARSGLIYKEKSKDIIMNLCMNRTIESGVETLRARLVYNKGAKGGSEFCKDWYLPNSRNNKFVCLGSITGMEAMKEILNTPEEVK